MNTWYHTALQGRGSRNRLLASADARGSALLRLGRRDRLLAQRMAAGTATVRELRVDEAHAQVRVQVEFAPERATAIYHFGLEQFAVWRTHLQDLGVSIGHAGAI